MKSVDRFSLSHTSLTKSQMLQLATLNQINFQLHEQSLIQRAFARWEDIPADVSKCAIDPVAPTQIEQTVVLFGIWIIGIAFAISFLTAECVHRLCLRQICSKQKNPNLS